MERKGEMSDEEVLSALMRGDLKMHEIERAVGGDVPRAVELRRAFVERKTGKHLRNIGNFSFDAEMAMRRNIENMIGAAQIPMGVAGPLLCKGDASGEFFIPLATTEGALVASVNRGCAAINRSGGAYAFVIADGMTRAPVFRANSVQDAINAVNFIRDNEDKMREIAESTSKHLKLKEIQPFFVGRNVFLRFVCETGDAMGMNMVTIATDEVSSFIEEHTSLRSVAISGNVCVDKKPSAVNLILGRGKTVIADVFLRDDVVEDVLKTTKDAMFEVVMRKCFVGSAFSSSLGFNAHFANIIAAIFIATGQDVAHTVEGSLGFTTAEVEEGGIHFAVTLPSLQVGTVGGGTSLGTQREALDIMGVSGSGSPEGSNARKFAAIVACAVLAGEISLIAAISARHLTQAHMRLNR